MATDNTAILAITKNGAALGKRLKELLTGSRLYLPEKFAAKEEADEHPFSLPAKEVVKEVFHSYRYVSFISL